MSDHLLLVYDDGLVSYNIYIKNLCYVFIFLQ
jgi:hypothetical protein